VRKSVTRVFVGALAAAGNVSKASALRFAGVITSEGTFSKIRVFSVVKSGAIGLAGAVSTFVGQVWEYGQIVRFMSWVASAPLMRAVFGSQPSMRSVKSAAAKMSSVESEEP